MNLKKTNRLLESLKRELAEVTGGKDPLLDAMYEIGDLKKDLAGMVSGASSAGSVFNAIRDLRDAAWTMNKYGPGSPEYAKNATKIAGLKKALVAAVSAAHAGPAQMDAIIKKYGAALEKVKHLAAQSDWTTTAD